MINRYKQNAFIIIKQNIIPVMLVSTVLCLFTDGFGTALAPDFKGNLRILAYTITPADTSPEVFSALKTWAIVTTTVAVIWRIIGNGYYLEAIDYHTRLAKGQEGKASKVRLGRTRILEGLYYQLNYLLRIIGYSLLLIIPGIQKMFGYAMAPYIINREHLSAPEALSKSDLLMAGHKMDLFNLLMKFWKAAIVCAFLQMVPVLLMIKNLRNPAIVIISLVCSILASILSSLLAGWISIARSAFLLDIYDNHKGQSNHQS